MSEHLAFEQFFAERRTVDRHKILFAPLAVIMYSLRKDLLSCSGFSGQQYGNICHRYLLRQRHRLFQHFWLPQDRIERVHLSDLLFQFFETDIHFCFLYGTTNERDNLVIIISFRYIIKRTVFDSLHPVGNIAVGSKKDHFYIGSNFFDIQNQIHSVSIRKKNIT